MQVSQPLCKERNSSASLSWSCCRWRRASLDRALRLRSEGARDHATGSSWWVARRSWARCRRALSEVLSIAEVTRSRGASSSRARRGSRSQYASSSLPQAPPPRAASFGALSAIRMREHACRGSSGASGFPAPAGASRSSTRRSASPRMTRAVDRAGRAEQIDCAFASAIASPVRGLGRGWSTHQVGSLLGEFASYHRSPWRVSWGGSAPWSGGLVEAEAPR
jgi:hypothetical protein